LVQEETLVEDTEACTSKKEFVPIGTSSKELVQDMRAKFNF
jgi:hypothetical protein